MKSILKSKNRFKKFKFESAKVGDYLIENAYLEPYILQLIKIDGDMLKVKPIAKIYLDGTITNKVVINFDFVHKDNQYISVLKVLPKKYINQINKLIIFS